MPEVCKLLIEIRKGRTWETWPRATFSFQSVSTEIHCRTGLRVGKAKRLERVTGNFDPVPSCMQPGSSGSPMSACYTSALFCSGNSLTNGRVYLSIRYAGGRGGDANGGSARRP